MSNKHQTTRCRGFDSKSIRKWIWPNSLKKRLFIVLMLISLLPLTATVLYTYQTIYEIEDNKIRAGLMASLEKERSNLEDVLNNMDYASKQYAIYGRIVDGLQEFMDSDNNYRRTEMFSMITKDMNFVNYANPNLGLIFYYFPEAKDQIRFENLKVDIKFRPDLLPRLTLFRGIYLYGPHETLYKNGTAKVFSLVRKVNINANQNVFVYVECNINLFEKILSPNQLGMDVIHMLVNDKGKVMFVDKSGLPRLSSEIATEVQNSGKLMDYELFKETSDQGWQLIVAIKKETLNKEMNTWMSKVILLALSTLILSVGLGLWIWWTFYKPMNVFRREIQLMANNRNHGVSWTNLEEFDDLLLRFRSMRLRVAELIDQAELKEREKQQLEIEKLLIQINPHFLHNTLNTVQWIARINGQHEIERLILLLTKILHYNLGKQGILVPISEEIDILHHYIDLQRIRYDFQFDVRIHVDPSIADVVIPRFLLQPLLENALYHGSSNDKAVITIDVIHSPSDSVVVSVTDNGAGMTKEEIMKLLTQNTDMNRKVGLGIGLQYVNRLLKNYYGENVQLEITSSVGNGTSISFSLPIRRKEEYA
jgi:two-component system sensor histidine kinase YesM